MKSYTNSRITYLIDEHIHHKRDREIMKMHYVDGISAEIIAKEIGKGDPQKELTSRRVSQILSDRLLAQISRFTMQQSAKFKIDQSRGRVGEIRLFLF